MNRKLHNTFLGLTASTAMLSLALALGAPAVQPEPRYALASAIEMEVLMALAEAGIEVEHAERAAVAAGAVADSMGGATDASSPDDDGLRRNRHSVVVPYFSFAPRG